jgi:hypothetical protein
MDADDHEETLEETEKSQDPAEIQREVLVAKTRAISRSSRDSTRVAVLSPFC